MKKLYYRVSFSKIRYMNKVLEYFKSNINKEVINQEIEVYGWEFNYKMKILGSVSLYLFEDLKFIEHIAKESNYNRDGRIKEKKYITIHDTGDTAPHRGAKYWSDAVYDEALENGAPYKASFQYVVGNDGLYHNIPDIEVAYHAGDTTQFDYTLYDTKIDYTSDFEIDIKEDGNYYINNQNTNIIAPTDKCRILSKNDFNDQGILCINKDGTFHIGETYFNETYKKIANRGGNNNSIGMEVCVTKGQDIYYNWQLSSKLTAYLLKQNNLNITDIKQHHFFSGKNCPQTLRRNNLWEHFLDMVKAELEVMSFIEEGYLIELIPISSNVLKNGRVLNKEEEVKFIIKTTYNGIEESYEF